MDLSFRRVAGRAVLAAGVCAAAILVVREPAAHRDVTYVIDPRPLGTAVRHVDVTITAGETVAAWQSTELPPGRPLRPLRLVTPAPGGPVQITLDVVTADGAHRVEHQVAPAAGATVMITLGQAP